MNAFYRTALACCTVLIISCGTAGNKKILPVNTMKTVMWDMMKADEWFVRTSQKDSLAKKKREDIRVYEQVFAVHRITRKQFYNSYKFYETHPVALKELLDSVDALSGRERLKLSATHDNAR